MLVTFSEFWAKEFNNKMIVKMHFGSYKWKDRQNVKNWNSLIPNDNRTDREGIAMTIIAENDHSE